MNAQTATATLETVTEMLKSESAFHCAEYKKYGNEYDKNHASAFEGAAKTAGNCGTLEEAKIKMIESFNGYLKAYKKDTCNFYYNYALATEKAARKCGATDEEIKAAQA